VKTVESALAEGNIYVTCTGNCDIITLEHMQRMRDQAIVCNIGHFDNEIQMARLEASDAVRTNIKPQVDKFTFPDGARHWLVNELLITNEGCPVAQPKFTRRPSARIKIEWPSGKVNLSTCGLMLVRTASEASRRAQTSGRGGCPAASG